MDGEYWVGQGSLKEGVCGWRLPSTVCRLIDPCSVVAREALLLITTSSHAQIHQQIKFPPWVSVHKHVKIPVFTGLGLSVFVSLCARLLKPDCWVYEGELFVCSVSLCQGDFTAAIWLVSPSPALPKGFSFTISLCSTIEGVFGKPKRFFVIVLCFFLLSLTLSIVFSTVLKDGRWHPNG